MKVAPVIAGSKIVEILGNHIAIKNSLLQQFAEPNGRIMYFAIDANGRLYGHLTKPTALINDGRWSIDHCIFIDNVVTEWDSPDEWQRTLTPIMLKCSHAQKDSFINRAQDKALDELWDEMITPKTKPDFWQGRLRPIIIGHQHTEGGIRRGDSMSIVATGKGGRSIFNDEKYKSRLKAEGIERIYAQCASRIDIDPVKKD